MQLNVLGVHDLALGGAARHGRRVKAGGILISGSAAGNSPIPNNATYAATKAFVNTFSESLRGELKQRRCACHAAGARPGARPTLPDAHEQSLVERLIPDFLWISTEYTAKLSLDGLDAQQDADRARASRPRRCRWPAGYAPRAIVTPIVGAVYKKLGGATTNPVAKRYSSRPLPVFSLPEYRFGEN